MKVHELKCWSSAYEAVERGEKTFEFRRNDRDFAVGDALVLVKWDPAKAGGLGGYPRVENAMGVKETLRAEVTYVLHGGQFGVPAGHCVMSIALKAAGR